MSRESGPRLVMVYNAESSPVALVLDFAHRIVSPSTYECRLCDLSYGHFTMKAEWKSFLATLPVPVTFFLKDRFAKEYPSQSAAKFPAGFLVDAVGECRQIISADELDATHDLAELKALVASKVNAAESASPA